MTLSNGEMRALTRTLKTKSDKIRTLGQAGVRPADIARFLRIRYQHAYNVLKHAGIEVDTGAAKAGKTAFAAPTGRGVAVLDESGCVRIPEAALKSWNAAPGDELLVRIEGDELRLSTRRAGLARARQIMKPYVEAGESLAGELIADRRREAARNG